MQKIGVNDPLAMQVWSKKLMTEVSKATAVSALIGTGKNAIIQLKEEAQKGPGDKVIFGLRGQLIGEGVSENQVLEGCEESLTTMQDSVTINELAHAVRVRNEGSIDQQRVPFSLREEAKDGLVDWYANRLSLMTFLHLCGYTAPRLIHEGREFNLKPTYYGFNEILAPSQQRIIRPKDKTSDAALDSKDIFTLSLIDKAVERAKLANPKIRPIRIGGDTAYVLYLHPSQVTALRSNTENGQWLDIQKSVYSGSRKNNPIFDGSLGMYNGVILREAEHITMGVDESTKTPIKNVRRAVLLGAQAAVIAFGKDRGPTRYKLVEELFDYQRELGIAAKTLIGIKKTRFGFTESRKEGEDFSTIVLSTYVHSS